MSPYSFQGEMNNSSSDFSGDGGTSAPSSWEQMLRRRSSLGVTNSMSVSDGNSNVGAFLFDARRNSLVSSSLFDFNSRGNQAQPLTPVGSMDPFETVDYLGLSDPFSPLGGHQEGSYLEHPISFQESHNNLTMQQQGMNGMNDKSESSNSATPSCVSASSSSTNTSAPADGIHPEPQPSQPYGDVNATSINFTNFSSGMATLPKPSFSTFPSTTLQRLKEQQRQLMQQQQLIQQQMKLHQQQQQLQLLQQRQQQMQQQMQNPSGVSSTCVSPDAKSYNMVSPSTAALQKQCLLLQQQQTLPPVPLTFATDGSINETSSENGEDGDDDQNRFKPFHEEKWGHRYKELLQFHAKHGHSAVPHTWPENPQLARWVKRQRRQYKLRKDGRPSTMTVERLELLNEVGFIWDSHDVNWREKLEALNKYRKEFGNCNVPSNFRDKKLATWVKCQRRQYKLYWDGKPSAMNPERIAELEKIGFEWEVRANSGNTTSSSSNANTPTTTMQHPATSTAAPTPTDSFLMPATSSLMAASM